ncbi:major pollen allergen Art v 1-like protein [Tanacetum coccineum]
MAKSSYVFCAALLIFVLAIAEIEAAAPKLCEKASKTYSGKCDNKKCDKKCIDWEKAQHGACHKREGKDACFCYFDCSKAPPGAKPAPPGAAPPPAPSSGGSPPPPADGGSPPPPADGGSPPADGGSPPPPSAH